MNYIKIFILGILLIFGCAALISCETPQPRGMKHKEMKNACNPCGMKNACNPCGGGSKANIDLRKIMQPKGKKVKSSPSLVSFGKKLFNDKKLSKTKAISCATCHTQISGGPFGMMKPGFAKPYPHYVEMAKQRAGIKKINAAEMVQFCMVVPMKAPTFAWDSKDLAALTSYIHHIQKKYNPHKAMKHSGKNPCNPCGG